MRKNIFYLKTDSKLSDDEIKKLKHRYEKFPTSYIDCIIKEYFRCNAMKISPIIAWGIQHVLFRVDLQDISIVVRANVTSKSDDYFYVERWASNKLKKNGLPSYNVYAVDTTRRKYPFDFMVTDFVKDKDMESMWPLNEKNEKMLLYQCGEILAKIHEIKTKGFGFFDNELAKKGETKGILNKWEDYIFSSFTSNLNYLRKRKLISSKKQEIINKIFLDNKKNIRLNEGVLVHGDYCDHNIMVSDNKITGVVDWEDCISGDPIFDIAFWSTFYSRDRLNLLLNGYTGIKHLPGDFEKRLDIYRLRIAISKAVLRHRYKLYDKLSLALDLINEEIRLLK